VTDRRSPEAASYRKLYKSSSWRKGRLVFLRQHPLCERCAEGGRIVPASVVNHRKPHKGNIELFFDTRNWQALCAPCHDRHAQSEEKTGKAIPRRGPDGWPLPPE
jgi:5-methylcytosine-specific restriction endonuclease McrA